MIREWPNSFQWNVKWLVFSSRIMILSVAVNRDFSKQFSVELEINICSWTLILITSMFSTIFATRHFIITLHGAICITKSSVEHGFLFAASGKKKRKNVEDVKQGCTLDIKFQKNLITFVSLCEKYLPFSMIYEMSINCYFL